MTRSFVHASTERHPAGQGPERLLDRGQITLEVSAVGRDGFVDQPPDGLCSRDACRPSEFVKG